MTSEKKNILMVDILSKFQPNILQFLEVKTFAKILVHTTLRRVYLVNEEVKPLNGTHFDREYRGRWCADMLCIAHSVCNLKDA